MPIYNKTISNEAIFALIPSSCKRVLLVVCGGCTNESLAYDKKLPFSVLNDEGVRLPFAANDEAERISRFLVQKGFSVRHTSLLGDVPVLCIYTDDTISYSMDYDFCPDIVLALSCPAGAAGLRMRTDKTVVAITEQVGSLSFTWKEVDGKRTIVDGRTNVNVTTV